MEEDTFLNWLFPALYRSSRYCFPGVCSPNVLKENTHLTQTIVCRLIVSVLQTNSVLSRFLLLSSSFNSRLSVNPSWVKWCTFKTSQRSHPLERAQDQVKFFPPWSGERSRPQSPSFLDHVVGKRLWKQPLPDVRKLLTSGRACAEVTNITAHAHNGFLSLTKSLTAPLGEKL